MMSKRFDKIGYSDFGLIKINDRYFREKDNSEWMPAFLYDFGWGPERGFYKKPLGNFVELMKILLESKDDEDVYGAAAIIEQKYITELKEYLLKYIELPFDKTTYYKLKGCFKLERAFNRTIKTGMSMIEISNEYERWKKISNFFD